MNPAQNSPDALSSLYQAFGMTDNGAIRCFARASDDTKNCTSPLPETRRNHIETRLQALSLYEARIEDSNASETVEIILKELANKLVCNGAIGSHAAKLKRDGKKDRGNVEYIYFSLKEKFESWQLSGKVEEGRNKQQCTPTRPPWESSAKHKADRSTSKNMRASNQDRQKSSEDCEEWNDKDMDDEDAWDKRRWNKPRRPQLVRESPKGEREVLVTPVRSRPLRNRCMVSSSTRAARESFESPSSLSHSDDEFIASPESVTSPDPSEVFTPFSAILTPDSVVSTMSFESRRSSFGTAYRKRQDASPTRGAGLTDLDILSRDLRRKLNVSERISDEERDLDNESSSDTRSRNTQSNEGVVTRPRSPQPMKLCLNSQPVRKILNCMEKQPDEKTFAPGFIYGFSVPSIQGHIKIGSTMHRAGTRMTNWSKQCEHPDLKVEFVVPVKCAVGKMEQLVHRTLHSEQASGVCPAEKCKKKHREWFMIGKDEALAVVKIWQQFSELEPYDDSRELNDIWKSIVTAQRSKSWSKMPNSDTKKWLKQELRTIVSKERELRLKLASAEQTRKELEQQLSKVAEKERCLREQLKELEISDK